jgi:uncharacterized protein (TIGR01370 family)
VRSSFFARNFGIQYWGLNYSAEHLARAPHDLLIVEASKLGRSSSATGVEIFFTTDEILTMRQGGKRPVVAYLNLAEIEPDRDYCIGTDLTRNLPSWFGGHSTSGEVLAAFWTPEWQSILTAITARLMGLGFDGLFLDDAMHYYTWMQKAANRDADFARVTPAAQPTEFFPAEMMELVIRLTAQVRAQNDAGLIIVNNAIYVGSDAVQPAFGPRYSPIFDRYRSCLDAVLIESAMRTSASNDVVKTLQDDFLARGVPVLTVDYPPVGEAHTPASFLARTARRSRKAGFIPYVSQDHKFDRLCAPPPSQG